MTEKPMTVRPETALVDVAKLLTDNKFNGVPVVDAENTLVGIITEYNLISGQMGIHLPTLQKVLGDLPVFSKDQKDFSDDVASVTKLTAKDIMNVDPFSLASTSSYEEVVKAFQSHHAINPIPVIDPQRKLVGVVSRYDVLKPLFKK